MKILRADWPDENIMNEGNYMTEVIRNITDAAPRADGYRMPGEFEPHDGCLMIWPFRPGSWRYGAVEAKKVFTRIAQYIAESEKMYMLVKPELMQEAKEYLLSRDKKVSDNIQLISMESDDSWARDVCPTFVKADSGRVRGISWRFNAWGGAYDGLYASWEKDDAVAVNCCNILSYECYCVHDFVLEGGSIHSDGEGTLLVTEACLLSKGRNPQMSRAQIEERLKENLSVEKIIWLPRGIYNDETNEHVDNICAYVRPGEVVLAWTDREDDPQYPLSKSCLEVLERETDAKGRHFKIHKMYIPDMPITVTEEQLSGYDFEEGEDTREVGERLAASYVNFYIANGSVLVPQFGDPRDRDAVQLLQELFPERMIYPIEAGEILAGGGNIHCITQQIPKKECR